MLLKSILLSSLLLQIHSWYPALCCSDTDCKPVPCEEISEVDKGFSYQGVFFSKDKEQPSKDNQCHVCMIPGASEGLCLFTLQST